MVFTVSFLLSIVNCLAGILIENWMRPSKKEDIYPTDRNKSHNVDPILPVSDTDAC
jgi:hypothetical protein